MFVDCKLYHSCHISQIQTQKNPHHSSTLKLFYGYHARLECGRLFGSSPGWVKPKTIKLVFAASLLSMQRKGVNMGWLRIRKMCPVRVTCLPADCCLYVHVALFNVVMPPSVFTQD